MTRTRSALLAALLAVIVGVFIFSCGMVGYSFFLEVMK
jgi:hypothetical protein